MKNIILLGSTGSIGVQTLDVCRNLDNMRVSALSAYGNIDLLESQIREFCPEAAVVADEKKAAELAARLKQSNIKTEIFCGVQGLSDVADVKADMLVNALVGSVGLLPTLRAIDAGMDIALANKETLVCGGELVMKAAAEKNVRILPVDSEHSAIFQCLEGNNIADVEKLILTASGGPFREYTPEQLKAVTKKDALKHPNWSMGEKITIDSATLMNKGLEVIEARWLFGVPAENIDVLVHPQSIVHSMAQFTDGSVIAQLGPPDMRLPIQYALCYPQRMKNTLPRLCLAGMPLTFEKPRYDVFPCLRLAYAALETGAAIPAVMNAANETAVARFLRGEIPFDAIYRIIDLTINEYTIHKGTNAPARSLSASDILEADEWARAAALSIK